MTNSHTSPSGLTSTMHRADCMKIMRTYDDKQFDLAIVDPPYGIGKSWAKDPHSKFYKHRSSYSNDKIPSGKYFAQLFRVANHQIIWGANYYTKHLSSTNHWIVWDKKRDWPTQHASEGELAWHSFNIPLRIYAEIWNGACCRNRSGIHPHEKPVSLYEWLLLNYAKPGQHILDTHAGSQSLRIAAWKCGMHYTGMEIDPEYYADGNKRFEDFIRKPTLFPLPQAAQPPEQLRIQ